MNGEQDDWPVRDATGGIVLGDARTSRTQWADDRAAESDEFRFALDKLVAAGCDRLKIAWLLSALANAQRWQDISRDDVRRIVNALEQAASGLKTLFFSQLNQLLGLESRKLEGELRELAQRVQELEPKVHQRRPMGRDLVRATLVHYVKETTGQYHDDRVAALISVAESLNAMEPPDEGPGDGYTMDAHVQWRGRDSCKDFLNGPSDAVRELLEAMSQDLKG